MFGRMTATPSSGSMVGLYDEGQPGEIRRLIESNGLRRLEDGPLGGTPLHFGNGVIGRAIDAPIFSGWRVESYAYCRPFISAGRLPDR